MKSRTEGGNLGELLRDQTK
ncbi:hypothetical protein CAEBREN_29076 [Caenorhabditis brenneri]|uniref:Uncharacterized protein n=1 Tax=Caenorhabditis brenneri TaxID=135651 RepID=G0MX48_CAEBE|nr:hypothetical protein CAEBREN_29076 [Caenorhabditis brenneri]